MPRISLCMIVKNEEYNLHNCLASVAGHVDEIIVVDTGSTDRTKEVAVKFGASVYQYDQASNPESFFVDDEATCRTFDAPAPFSGEIALGNFAGARNESFRHATGDYVMWIDADDVLDDAHRIRDVVAEMEKRSLSIAFLPYNYATDGQGRVFYRQWRERIFKRGCVSWHNPVHEVAMPKDMVPLATERFEAPVYQHRRKADRASIPNRNYKLLLRQYAADKREGEPIDPRALFYLGQEARFIEPIKAMAFYEEYLKKSGWAEERSAAHCAIGSLLEFGMVGLSADESLARANQEYATAATEMPENPDGLLGMARIAYLRGRPQDCINYTERAFRIGNTDTMLGTNPMDRLYRPHVYYNHALAQVGRIEEAIKSCEAGLSICPDDPGVPGGASGMLALNLNEYKRHLAQKNAPGAPGDMQNASVLLDKNEDVDAPPKASIPTDAMVIWALQLWKQNVSRGDLDRAERLISALPERVASDPVVARMLESTRRRAGLSKPIESDTVVFYLGPGVEYWDPTTPNKQGLGGSETACINMALWLAHAGKRVTVYAEAEGSFGGVEYIHHSKFKGASCDVFIASRTPWASLELGPIRANLKLLWVHDIHCGPASPQMERWLYQFDRILCLSQWHREYFLSCYPTVDKSSVLVTRNGIDPIRFGQDEDLPWKQNRMVFSSSPNRGIIELLAALPKIRERIPDAHVDIFYGFDTWETMAKQRNSQEELKAIAGYKKAISDAEVAGYATFHGRRPQTEIADAFLRAKIWAYPTSFPETSCISAMEAQAAACVPVYFPVAALKETVKHGIACDQVSFVDECVRMLANENERNAIAKEARAYAIGNLSWESLARQWLLMFEQLRKDVAAFPIRNWRNDATVQTQGSAG